MFQICPSRSHALSGHDLNDSCHSDSSVVFTRGFVALYEKEFLALQKIVLPSTPYAMSE